MQDKRGFTALFLILSVVVIAFLAILAYALFSYGSLRKQSDYQLPTVEEDQQLLQLKKQGSSDEIWEIEKDINATELDNLDFELSEVEAAESEL